MEWAMAGWRSRSAESRENWRDYMSETVSDRCSALKATVSGITFTDESLIGNFYTCINLIKDIVKICFDICVRLWNEGEKYCDSFHNLADNKAYKNKKLQSLAENNRLGATDNSWSQWVVSLQLLSQQFVRFWQGCFFHHRYQRNILYLIPMPLWSLT